MNSLPSISHRLFVAALNEENGLRTSRRRTRAIVRLGETTVMVRERSGDAGRPAQDVAARSLTARAGASGS